MVIDEAQLGESIVREGDDRIPRRAGLEREDGGGKQEGLSGARVGPVRASQERMGLTTIEEGGDDLRDLDEPLDPVRSDLSPLRMSHDDEKILASVTVQVGGNDVGGSAGQIEAHMAQREGLRTREGGRLQAEHQ
jgi:hypothetical protein